MKTNDNKLERSKQLCHSRARGNPETKNEKLVIMWQCIEKIWINKPTGEIKLAIHQVPAGNLQNSIEIKTSILRCPR